MQNKRNKINVTKNNIKQIKKKYILLHEVVLSCHSKICLPREYIISIRYIIIFILNVVYCLCRGSRGIIRITLTVRGETLVIRI